MQLYKGRSRDGLPAEASTDCGVIANRVSLILYNPETSLHGTRTMPQGPPNFCNTTHKTPHHGASQS